MDQERLRLPITKDILHDLLKRVDLVTEDTCETHLYKAIFSSAYHGLCHISELVETQHAMQLGNVVQLNGGMGMRLILPSTKTLKPA